MNFYKPQVKDISLFREIAKNIVNPLEVLREAISNCHDAEAKTISIIIYRNKEGKFVLEIQDDGKGMNFDNIHKFFNLGDSMKTKLGIGEKGLGTKTFFKSEGITLYTQTRNNEAYKAIMNEPWDNLCKGILPKYTVEKIDAVSGKGGTIILIEGYVIDNPEKYFNFNTIKDYILWFTAAGSFKTYFANYSELHKYVHNMQIAPRVFLEDRMLGIKEEIGGVHQFCPPQENPKVDISEQIYIRSVNYCRHFGPFHRATNINGEYVSFQMYGTISGINCRKKVAKLRKGETLKSRFGIYLAKDFILFVKKQNLMTDPNYHHYHLIINSQAFELTADRNNISNEDDPKVKWIFEEAKKIICGDIMPLAEKGYFKLRKEEEEEDGIKDKRRRLKMRLECFDKIDDLLINELSIVKKPDNESQVVILFTEILGNEKGKNLVKHINKIGHYSHQSTTDMICLNYSDEKVLVEIEYKLSSLFKHDHPYETFDYVVCWEVDLDMNEKKKLRDGNILCLIQENEEWILKYGTQKVIPIIELKMIVNNFKNNC
ncbi:ATP-binding protein [Marinisporobacter balticus]|uniref:Histidine kinase/DNA gyrase B/HSP90-like ATPase n=1 Tax=Marinisporobacter balticus TaxID=2018667 RepID=A0A4R2KXS9_9FIRM|nr:ATP-binding protein [Marinisporobacter balticus]TCO79421.1 histidine kinase/DNA gyrase B/HSP90-like ATPase [Marinisporobacter balticus]